ncbi:MAG: MFS transporter [Lachnospiraceae bacterium]|nr:MFS transporter [Lachnospiraceae bacterium]
MNKKQKLLLFLCWLLYFTSQLGRYSYSSNITHIMDKYSVSHASAGLVTTFFFISYGVGQLVNAFLCKKYNKRWVLSGALIISSLINLAVFLGIGFEYIKYLWLINGLVQSVLWASLILTLSEHLNKEHLGRASLIMSTTTFGGTAFIYGLSALFSIGNYFEYVFLICSVILLAVGLIWLFAYSSVSRGAKQAFQAEQSKDSLQNASNEKKAVFIARDILFVFVLLAVFMLICNLITDGVKTWVPTILKEEYGLPDGLSIFLALFLPMCGVIGAFLAQLIQKFTKNFVIAAGSLFAAAGALLAIVICCLHTVWIVVLLLFVLLTVVMGAIANLLTSRFPLFMRDKGNSGFMSGILNGCGYIGSAISTFALGLVADAAGWNEAFYLLLLSAAIPVITLIVYTVVLLIKKKKNKNLTEKE